MPTGVNLMEGPGGARTILYVNEVLRFRVHVCVREREGLTLIASTVPGEWSVPLQTFKTTQLLSKTKNTHS